MGSFQKDNVVKIGGGFPLLRAEYISNKKGFDKEKYQHALENYSKTIESMSVIPLDDFYRIGIEHFHELSEEHQKMLIKLKNNSDKLEHNAIPSKINLFVDSIKQVAKGFDEIEQEYPDVLNHEDNPKEKIKRKKS